MLLVQGRGEIAILPAVTSVRIHQIAIDTLSVCRVVSTG